MPQAKSRSAGTLGSRSGLWTAIGAAVAVLFFLVSGAISLSDVQVVKADNTKIVHSHEVITALDELLSTVKDAETGKRGFLLTQNEKYLQPYEDAVSRVEPALSA